MATPREQHAARGHAHVVGSGHLDGREPLVENRDEAATGSLQRGDADRARTGADTGGVQRAVDAASGEPRSGDADTERETQHDDELHPAPTRQRPHPDNTDRRG